MRRSSRSKLTFTLAEGLPSTSWLLLSLRQRVGGTEKSSSPPLYAQGLAQCLTPGRHSHICLPGRTSPIFPPFISLIIHGGWGSVSIPG